MNKQELHIEYVPVDDLKFLLAESHFAIHTFPECGISYLELSSCVDKPFDRFLDMVKGGGIAIVSPIVRHSGDMGYEAD